MSGEDGVEVRLRRAEADLTEIRALMGTVAVYGEAAEVSPLVLMVSELVRDHEELEARIDRALMELMAALKSELSDEVSDDRWRALARTADLLRGAGGVPDTPEGVAEG